MNRYTRFAWGEHARTWFTGLVLVFALYGTLLVLAAW